MFIGGPGGTGKSQVIDAISHFCNSWGVSSSLRICAPTGIAASLIGGQIVHSLLGLRAGTSVNLRRRVPKKHIEEHRNVVMLILDEISMLGRKILGALDLFFRQVKETDAPFGGVILILCGEFFQVSSIAIDAIFSDPKLSKRKTNVLDDLAFQTWKNLDHVISLEESVRHKEDIAFDEFLSRLRLGETTEDDMKYVNARVISQQIKAELDERECSDAPLVVRNNDLRMALNWCCVRLYCNKTLSKPIVCVAEITSKQGKKRHTSQVEIIFNTCDTDTGNLASLLPLIVEMPVRISQNISVELGIANGTDGLLVGMEFSPSNTFQKSEFSGSIAYFRRSFPVSYMSVQISVKGL